MITDQEEPPPSGAEWELTIPSVAAKRRCSDPPQRTVQNENVLADIQTLKEHVISMQQNQNATAETANTLVAELSSMMTQLHSTLADQKDQMEKFHVLQQQQIFGLSELSHQQQFDHRLSQQCYADTANAFGAVEHQVNQQHEALRTLYERPQISQTTTMPPVQNVNVSGEEIPRNMHHRVVPNGIANVSGHNDSNDWWANENQNDWNNWNQRANSTGGHLRAPVMSNAKINAPPSFDGLKFNCWEKIIYSGATFIGLCRNHSCYPPLG